MLHGADVPALYALYQNKLLLAQVDIMHTWEQQQVSPWCYQGFRVCLYEPTSTRVLTKLPTKEQLEAR